MGHQSVYAVGMGHFNFGKKKQTNSFFFIMSDIINPCCCVNIVGVFLELHRCNNPKSQTPLSPDSGKCFPVVLQHSAYANNVPLVRGYSFTTFTNLRQPIDGLHGCFVRGRYLFHCIESVF